MKKFCSRCSKAYITDLSVLLCDRCQDILEFGYQSFPAYPLQEKVRTFADLPITGEKELMTVGSIVLYEGAQYEVMWAYPNGYLELKPTNEGMTGTEYVKDYLVILLEEKNNEDQFQLAMI